VAAAVAFGIVMAARYHAIKAESGEQRATHVFGSAVAVVVQLIACELLMLAAFRNFKVALFIPIAIGIRFAYLLLQWHFRNRRAGPLVLDASRPRPFFVKVWFIFMVVALPFGASFFPTSCLHPGHSASLLRLVHLR
jgi:hypothetical protein